MTEKFRSLILDQHDFLYLDERLVIPKTLRPIIMRSLHYGHPGRDSMLATLSNVWWPRLHREVVAIARSCPQCRESGTNIKTILTQKQIGKLPKCVENGVRTLRPRTLRPKQTLRPNVNYAQGN